MSPRTTHSIYTALSHLALPGAAALDRACVYITPSPRGIHPY